MEDICLENASPGNGVTRMYFEGRSLWQRTRRLLLALLVMLVGQPVMAQGLDIAGLWRPLPRNQDGSGMTGDMAGVPVSEGLRARAESWSPGDFDVAEWVCRPHAWDYSLEGPLSPIRFWPEIDQATQKVIAYHGHINQQEQETTIWMETFRHK
jgi:hypothetical protein